MRPERVGEGKERRNDRASVELVGEKSQRGENV